MRLNSIFRGGPGSRGSGGCAVQIRGKSLMIREMDRQYLARIKGSKGRKRVRTQRKMEYYKQIELARGGNQKAIENLQGIERQETARLVKEEVLNLSDADAQLDLLGNNIQKALSGVSQYVKIFPEVLKSYATRNARRILKNPAMYLVDVAKSSTQDLSIEVASLFPAESRTITRGDTEALGARLDDIATWLVEYLTGQFPNKPRLQAKTLQIILDEKAASLEVITRGVIMHLVCSRLAKDPATQQELFRGTINSQSSEEIERQAALFGNSIDQWLAEDPVASKSSAIPKTLAKCAGDVFSQVGNQGTMIGIVARNKLTESQRVQFVAVVIGYLNIAPTDRAVAFISAFEAAADIKFTSQNMPKEIIEFVADQIYPNNSADRTQFIMAAWQLLRG